MYFQVEKFGKPTWKRLVEAVEDKVGGNNPALAQKIAKDHPSNSNTKCEYLIPSVRVCFWFPANLVAIGMYYVHT